MKKVMVIHAYGENYEYSLYMVSNRNARRALRLMEKGEWAEAYNLVVKHDRTTKRYYDRIDWHDLDTIDILLEYIPDVTI
ncbi:MAG: hypothetical protein QXD42_06265 [Nitrososphaerales archaeon]